MAALAFTRMVMFAVRHMPAPLRHALDHWARRQAQRRRERRLRQLAPLKSSLK
jgi:hypothetical protein